MSQSESKTLSFWEHVGELRLLLFRLAAILACGFLLSLIFYRPLSSLILSPLKGIARSYSHTILIKEEIRAHAPLTYTLPEHGTVCSTSKEAEALSPTSYFLPKGSFLILERPKAPFSLLSPAEGVVAPLLIALFSSLVFTSPFVLALVLRFLLPALSLREKKGLTLFLLLSLFMMGGGGCSSLPASPFP